MARPYESLFAPASVAVVGASGDPSKWGYWLARGALDGQDRRRVRFVNRSGEPVLEQPSVKQLSDLDEPVELVVISVPARGYASVVDEALALGARAIVGITSGLDADESRAIAARVKDAGAVLLGPNCMGVADTHARLNLVWGDLPSGSIALLSQSGNLAIELGRLAAHEGLGFSRFASLGNEHDVSAADLLDTVAADPGTAVVALYVEDFSRVRELAESAQRCLEAGTPVVLLAAGRSEVARRAAASHTGAMAGSRSAIEAACRAAGIALVDTPAELIDVAHALTARGRLHGRRIGVVGDGGGHGVVSADLASASGFSLPTFDDALQQSLLASLPDMATAANPVDLAGGGEQDHMNYARTMTGVLESGAVDAGVMTGYFGAYGSDEPRLAEIEADVARAVADAVERTGRPVVVHSVAPTSPTCAVLRSGGVPVLRRIEGAMAGLRGLAAAAERTGVPVVPAAAEALAKGDAYVLARGLCQERGVQFPGAHFVSEADAAAAAAEELGFPVVVKALDLAHKSDVGGVHLGLMSASAVHEAVTSMIGRLGPRLFTVESMVTLHGVELIVGARHDEGAGPIVMVGLGGVQAEVIKDVRVELGPVTDAQARTMLLSLRSAPLLTGFRGSQPVDLDAAAHAVAVVSQVLAEHPEIESIELNPVLATPDGCVSLDAHLELRAAPTT